ncbi:MAG: hypothetical protein IT473_02335 [Lysobacter sp.]|nr:hypothetical protein [Lysobacter sp.]
MPNADDIRWFKERFQTRILPALAGTPIGVDLIVALACQETGEVWPTLRKKGLSEDTILALCVGDTLDADRGRRAFPQTKADLIAAPRGEEMFAIARKALVDMAAQIPAYAPAAARPNKFCHGYGLFQRDLQFFKVDPQYFLQRKYERFEHTLAQCLGELKRGLNQLGFQNRTSLTDMESASVAIAYNTGRFVASRGLKQGHFNGTKFYGEAIFDFIRLSKTVAVAAQAPVLPTPQPGEAIVAPPTPVAAQGGFFKVDTRISTLRLRREAKISTPPTANVIGELPDGHPVRAITGKAVNGFMEVETSLNGAVLRGFASTNFLKADPTRQEIPVVQPAPRPPREGIVAVSMPRKPGTLTRRKDPANAHSLNEDGQPTRRGQDADALRAEIAKIVDWLAVDKLSHARYRPRSGVTFCNIYAHDFCHLAGAYLPRVWWSPRALIDLQAGKRVEPLIGDTIFEMRANDLFRWLRDFGPDFGWRRTGTATKLQQEANQGAIGLIVALRKIEHRSGHITVVVPETADERAKRDTAGEVTSPLISQAGVRNFRYGNGAAQWWKHEQFADSAFWLHA